MSTLLDAHGKGYHPVIAGSMDGDRDRGNMWWGWIFALVIIFLVIIFAWRREHGTGLEAAIPALLAGGVGRPADTGHTERWDLLKDFGDVSKDIQAAARDQEKNTDRYFFDTLRSMDQNTQATLRTIDQNTQATLTAIGNSDIRSRDNTDRVIARIEAFERSQRDAEDRRREARITFLETALDNRDSRWGNGYRPPHGPLV